MIRVEQAMKILEMVDVEMDPGDALFFIAMSYTPLAKTTLIRPGMCC